MPSAPPTPTHLAMALQVNVDVDYSSTQTDKVRSNSQTFGEVLIPSLVNITLFNAKKVGAVDLGLSRRHLRAPSKPLSGFCARAPAVQWTGMRHFVRGCRAVLQRRAALPSRVAVLSATAALGTGRGKRCGIGS